MSLQAEETKVVTIEERSLAVDTLPAEAQQLVAFYDDWKERELNARSEMMMAQTAMRGLAQQIAQTVVAAEQAAEVKAAYTEGYTDPDAEAANEAGDDA